MRPLLIFFLVITCPNPALSIEVGSDNTTAVTSVAVDLAAEIVRATARENALGVSTGTHAALTGASPHGATTANTASQIVVRDGDGNIAGSLFTGSSLTIATDILVTYGGNVGVGTADPQYLLEIENLIANSDPTYALTNDAQSWGFQTRGGSSDRFQIMDLTGGKVPFIIYPGSDDFRFTINDGVGVDDSDPDGQLEILSESAPTGFIFAVSSQTDTTGDIFAITGNGNVGIGFGAPSSKFEVRDGTITISTTTGDFGIRFQDNSFQNTAVSIVATSSEPAHSPDVASLTYVGVATVTYTNTYSRVVQCGFILSIDNNAGNSKTYTTVIAIDGVPDTDHEHPNLNSGNADSLHTDHHYDTLSEGVHTCSVWVKSDNVTGAQVAINVHVDVIQY